MNTVYLKESNLKIISDYAKYDILPDGKTIQALYKLIQTKGEPIQSEDKKYNGVMCLKFYKGQYIALKRSGGNDKFYQCAITKLFIKDIK